MLLFTIVILGSQGLVGEECHEGEKVFPKMIVIASGQLFLPSSFGCVKDTNVLVFSENVNCTYMLSFLAGQRAPQGSNRWLLIKPWFVSLKESGEGYMSQHFTKSSGIQIGISILIAICKPIEALPESVLSLKTCRLKML